MSALRRVVALGLIFISAAILARRQDTAMLLVLVVIVALLLLFSLTYRVMRWKRHPMAKEVEDRTLTWWWMIAVFMLALATHRLVSFVFLGLLCFAALREYYSLPRHSQSEESNAFPDADRAGMVIAYLTIPVVVYVAYIEWYELFIILVPVYLFLLLPSVFVIQGRTTGAIRSLGFLSLGFMFFVFNLGHCLFMINMGPIVLLFCFSLTEARDAVAYGIGGWTRSLVAKSPDATWARVLDYRIASDVSPNKTWAVGVLSAVVISLLSLVWVPLMPEFPDGRLTYAYCALIGLAIGFLGLMGDLVFSMVKRDVGAKDFGALLPGHGGIIDRIDSLIYTVPITFHMIAWHYF